MITFPNNPTLNQITTINGKVFKFDGVGWIPVSQEITNIVQSTGTSTVNVMSQKAVTNELEDNNKEAIKFKSTTDIGIVTRPYNFKITNKVEYIGTVTLKRENGVLYTLGENVNAGECIEVTANLLNTLVFLTIIKA